VRSIVPKPTYFPKPKFAHEPRMWEGVLVCLNCAQAWPCETEERRRKYGSRKHTHYDNGSPCAECLRVEQENRERRKTAPKQEEQSIDRWVESRTVVPEDPFGPALYGPWERVPNDQQGPREYRTVTSGGNGSKPE
jgi:hypothetical protein